MESLNINNFFKIANDFLFSSDNLIKLGLKMITMIKKKENNSIESVDNNENFNYNVADIYFNLACIYSIINDKQKAIKNLSLAIGINADYKEKALNEKDLVALQHTVEFKEIIDNEFIV